MRQNVPEQRLGALQSEAVTLCQSTLFRVQTRRYAPNANQLERILRAS